MNDGVREKRREVCPTLLHYCGKRIAGEASLSLWIFLAALC